MKTCARCKKVLPASSFPPNPRLKSGLHSYCRPCRTAKNAERPKNQRVPEMEKCCTSCDRLLDASHFMSNVNSSDGLRSRCKACTSSTQILRKYHLTSDQYADLAKNGCHICGSYKRLHIDHDHSCCPRADSGSATICGKCVRGVLCSDCNTGLGLFHDSPVALTNAVKYLQRQRPAQ